MRFSTKEETCHGEYRNFAFVSECTKDQYRQIRDLITKLYDEEVKKK